MPKARHHRRVTAFALLLTAACLLFAGCAGTQTRFMSRAGRMVPIDIEPDKATVVFLRPSGYGRVARFFVVDGEGQYLGDVQGKEYFVHQFAPGSHKFVSWAENSEMLEADLAPGKIYYVLLSVRMGIWTARMSISALNPKRGEWVKRVEIKARDALEFVGIADLALEPASVLSHGDLKRLEVARAIATDPELLVLDEPFGGLNPAETELMAKSIRRLHKGGRFGRLHSEGPAMLIIEPAASQFNPIAESGYISQRSIDQLNLKRSLRAYLNSKCLSKRWGSSK